jgi:methyl-accepting chemotaxis protein
MGENHPARPALAGRVSVIVVALVALVAVGLLHRTQSNAAQIRSKTERIAASAEGINTYTDAILKLEETNRLAGSILRSVRPISAPLKDIGAQSADIARIMRSINGSTGSIDGSASSIDGSASHIRTGVEGIGTTAGAIAERLRGVNAGAARILEDLRLLETGVRIIGDDLGATSRIVRDILADARGIDTASGRTEHLAACIDNGLNGGQACAARKDAGQVPAGPPPVRRAGN